MSVLITVSRIDSRCGTLRDEQHDGAETSQTVRGGNRCSEARGLGYQNWSVVAGYFDGDGNVEEVVGSFVVSVKLGFTDNWDKQLLAVRVFLESNGVRVGYLSRRMIEQATSAWQVRISNIAGVLNVSKKMLPYAFKKKAELKAVVDYLEDKITGDEFVARVNDEVGIGNKVGKLRTSKLPFTRSEGVKLKYDFSLQRAHAATRTEVPEEEARKIRETYHSGLSIRKLSDLYGYGTSVIQRILGMK